MPLWVFNMTGYFLEYAGVIHDYGDKRDMSDYPQLDNGSHFVSAITVNDDTDMWTVDAYSQWEGTLFREGKQCGVEYSDVQHGGFVAVIFGPKAAGFSIVLPSSSSCWGNHYGPS